MVQTPQSRSWWAPAMPAVTTRQHAPRSTMLRLRRHHAEEVPEPPLVDTPWKVMTATEPAPQASETLELRKPGSNEVVRIGPTVTQVAGFGRHADVVDWIASAMAMTPLVI